MEASYVLKFFDRSFYGTDKSLKAAKKKAFSAALFHMANDREWLADMIEQEEREMRKSNNRI